MNRLPAALFLVGCLFLFSVEGQDTGSSDNSGGGGGGGSGGSGAATAPTEGGGQETAPTVLPSATAPTTPAEAAAPVVMPGVYGTSPIAVTPGQGRFAKPPYDFTFTLQQGYDTNVFTTHTDPTASAVTNGQLGFQLQAATPRTIYTVDATLGAMYYWNRPGVSPLDYSGNLSLLYFHRFTPRLNISAVVNVAYLTQPDFAAINAPTNQSSGNYILASSRFNLAYQWASRFETNTSYSLASTLYEQKSSQANNLYDNTLGNEFRYLLTPRTALVAEGRIDATTYPKQKAGDSTSAFLLLGADYSFSSRLNVTLRGGDEFRSYQTGGTQGSPYGEFNVTYIYGHQSSISWSNRFGLDDSDAATQKVTSFRTGLNVNHVLTAKMTALVGLNFNRTNTATEAQAGELIPTTPIPDPTPPIFFPNTIPATSEIQNQISASVGLQYLLTPKFSLNITNTLTEVSGTPIASDYIRNQIFLGGTYTF